MGMDVANCQWEDISLTKKKVWTCKTHQDSLRTAWWCETRVDKNCSVLLPLNITLTQFSHSFHNVHVQLPRTCCYMTSRIGEDLSSADCAKAGREKSKWSCDLHAIFWASWGKILSTLSTSWHFSWFESNSHVVLRECWATWAWSVTGPLSTLDGWPILAAQAPARPKLVPSKAC